MAIENNEKMLTKDETARYAFIESGCRFKDKKTNTENGASNAIITLNNNPKSINMPLDELTL